MQEACSVVAIFRLHCCFALFSVSATSRSGNCCYCCLLVASRPSNTVVYLRDRSMHSLRLQTLLWICCPGHAGVSGNERADRLASTADITCILHCGRAEVLRDLRNFLNMDRPEHHSTDRLKERGVEKGSGRHSTLQGRERSVSSQTNIGTVSVATFGRLLRDWAERVWAFPSATMPS